MKSVITACLISFFLTMIFYCSSQPSVPPLHPQSDAQKTLVGGPFEGREIMYIGMPDKITAVDTSPGWTQSGQKLLITGTIYQRDGRTPAPGIIMYYYHTDIHGNYAKQPGFEPQAIRHGFIRGWIKSDHQGKYAIYTVRPATYPNSDAPQHIHPAIKEPQLNEYYIDEFQFDDDKLLTNKIRQTLENRGGSGIIKVHREGDLQVAERNIVLGLNIPGYPNK